VSAKDPTLYVWWLVSRAAGIVALGLISGAVLIGLSMSTKITSKPKLKRTLMRLHEHIALVAVGAIVLHGVALLGDKWLKPGVSGIAIPFTMSYRPVYTGLGIIAGYLAAAFAFSFYARKRIGVKLWRKLHRGTVIVWALAVVHTLGSGSDAVTQWLRAFVLLPAVPIAYLMALRILQGRSAQTGRRQAQARPAENGRRIGGQAPMERVAVDPVT
jgi:sulfoxide reductase heme-binding subunit YedZ